MSLSQENYFEECEERSPTDVCLGDIAPLDEATRLIVENAYRRGYFQGYDRGTKDSDAPADLETFLYTDLYDWRYSKHGGKFTTPPQVRGR